MLVVVLLAIGAGLVAWKQKVGGHTEPMNRITKEEIELLLENAGKVNPMLLKRLAESPEMKKQQIDNLKQLLALASEARKEGATNELHIQNELKNIRAEITATSYDKEINKDKGPMPPFGYITEEQTTAYWAEDQNKNWWGSFKDKIGFGTGNHEADFQKFLDTKIKLIKEGNPQMAEREISEEEKKQARDFFGKIQIYEREANVEVDKSHPSQEEKDKWNKFKRTTDLQVKLQQAQFLAGIASKKLTDKMKVTDEDIAKYIAEHPELDPKEKRTKAEELLNRAKGGEDFAKLADEFSEDPGNKGPDGKSPQGGLYKDVAKGKMVAPFETAALALEPGQISPDLVETDFGYHIIKLERKGEKRGEDGKLADTYDARHILISNSVQDPEDPMSRPQPVKEMVRAKLEASKEKEVLDELLARNPVEVPEDFNVPAVSDEEIQQMMQKQRPQMPQPDMEGPDGPPAPESKKPEPKKPEPKKK